MPERTARDKRPTASPQRINVAAASPSLSFRAVCWGRAAVRMLLKVERQLVVFGLAIVLLIGGAYPFIAFEAHVVNVDATLVQLDPPIIDPPSGPYPSPIIVSITSTDPDATHIFYTVTPGLDVGLAVDPVCGDLLGGSIPLPTFEVTADAVVKAVTCDGADEFAHISLVAVAVYDVVNELGAISGYKYHDLDKSGSFTPGDFTLQGWRVTLVKDDVVVAETVTDSLGHYSFFDLEPGTYVVVEESRVGWQNITPEAVVVELEANEAAAVDYFNFDTGFSCLPKDISFPANLAVQAAGSSSSNDDVAIASNVTINGDVRSNDEIEQVGGGSNRNINGNATVTNSIDSGIVVSGTTTTGAPAVSLPDVMVSEWQARAQDGGTVNGSFNFVNNTVGLVMGPSEITGNLTFGSSNSVTIKGPLYVHGNLTIGSNSIITQDAAFGDQFVALIVDGLIDIDSNVSFVGAGTSGKFLLISTQAAVAGDDAAIATSSNNSDLGDVVLFATNGDIHIRSNRTLLAAFAAHGTGTDSDDNAAVRLDSNVTVNYRALPGKISCGPRQDYETTSHLLVNEFMPNPIGSDAGSAGLPLDGEWVELFNPTSISVDVAGWILYDEDNTHALPITSANTDTGGTVVPSLGYLVVYREGDGDFQLDNAGGDTVRLFSGLIGSGGVLVDSHTYTRSAPDNKSFSRVPDGAANWVDPDATPGQPNSVFFEPLAGPSVTAFIPDALPLLRIPDQGDIAEDRSEALALALALLPPEPPVEALASSDEPNGEVAGVNDSSTGDEASDQSSTGDVSSDQSSTETEPAPVETGVVPENSEETVAPENTTPSPEPNPSDSEATAPAPATESPASPQPLEPAPQPIDPSPNEPSLSE